MMKINFTPRYFFLFLFAVVLIFIPVACASSMPAATEQTEEAAPGEEVPTEASSSTEEVSTGDEPTPVSTAGVAPVVPTATSDTGGGGEAAPALLEFRRLTIEYPLRIKAGAESDIIRLTLEVDDLGNVTPTAEVEGNIIEGEVVHIPDLYATHIVTAEARYDVAGLEVKPTGAVFQPLKKGEKVTFYWSIRAQDVGIYRGTIWLYLNFEDRSSGEISQVPVSAQIVEIEAVDFFGFSTNFVRTSGLVGSVLGVVVGFPFFKDIAKYLYDKLTGNNKKKRSSKPARKT